MDKIALWSMGDIAFYICVSTLFTVRGLFSAIRHIFYLNKKLKTIKKHMIPWWQRFLQIHYVIAGQKYFKTATCLRYVYWIYLIIASVTAFAWIVVLIYPKIRYILNMIFSLKLFIFDVPIILYLFVMSTHDKIHGGVTFRWE